MKSQPIPQNIEEESVIKCAEKSLIVAVLGRAILDANSCNALLRAEARDWLFNINREHSVFGCSYLCDMMGIDRHSLCRSIKRNLTDKVTYIKITRVRRAVHVRQPKRIKL